MEEGTGGPKLLHCKLLLTDGYKRQSSHLFGDPQCHRDAQRVVQEGVILLQPWQPRATGPHCPILGRCSALDRGPAYLSPLLGLAIFMNITKRLRFRCLPPPFLHLSLFFSVSFLPFFCSSFYYLFFFFCDFCLLQTSRHLLQSCYESAGREAVKRHAISCLTARLSRISEQPLKVHTLLVIQTFTRFSPHSPARMPFSLHVLRSSGTRLQQQQLPPTLSNLFPVLWKGWAPIPVVLPSSRGERGGIPAKGQHTQECC